MFPCLRRKTLCTVHRSKGVPRQCRAVTRSTPNQLSSFRRPHTPANGKLSGGKKAIAFFPSNGVPCCAIHESALSISFNSKVAFKVSNSRAHIIAKYAEGKAMAGLAAVVKASVAKEIPDNQRKYKYLFPHFVAFSVRLTSNAVKA